MQTRWLPIVLLVSFIAVAAFGLYMPMAGHGALCPFSGGTSMCSSPIAHIGHWQEVVVVTLVQVLLLAAAAAFVFAVRHDLFDPDVGRLVMLRARSRVSSRPTLMQELFSDGILNRKEPSFFS